MRKRLTYILATLVAVAAVGALSLTFIHTAGAEEVLKAPEKLLYCGSCHTMETEVLTWQANAHKNVACLECHTEEDPGWVRHEFVDRNDSMAEAAKAHILTLKVADQRCEECHAPQMDDLMKDITPKPLLASTKAPDAGKAMDTKALHNKHIKGSAALKCVDCHTSDAHGPTEGSTPWRDQTHKACLDCHEQKQVKVAVTGSTSCGACHTQPATVAPADHKDKAAWTKSHGAGAANGTCGECHLAESAGPHAQISKPASFPSATKDACASCHGGVPMPHPQGFMSTHGKVSLASKPGTCETCHAAPTATTTPVKGSAQTCNSCHAQAMPHPANYLAIHDQQALAAPATCATCHSPSNPANPGAAHAQSGYCTNCHGGTMPHPAGFLAIHGEQALASPATCTNCHSPNNPVNPGAAYAQPGYCVDCHLTPMPHPAYFLGVHGIEAKRAPATCEACHSAKNVARPTAPHANAGYCATCHDSYQHEPGWVGDHGNEVTESCATCHTLQGQPGQHNACSTCHSANGQWHDRMWFAKHGPIVQKSGDESCMVCHNEVQPSCSKCHRDR